MQAALITLAQPEGDAPPVIGGRPVSAHQADLALSWGSELVLAHSGGTTPEAVALRQRVEDAGARFQTIASVHALAAVIGPEDALLVMQPGLLPEPQLALQQLGADPAILVLDAGAGVSAGFERIDLDRAWAGVLSLPGSVLGDVDALPEDCAPASVLLRVALQHNVPEQRLEDALLDQGRWIILPDQTRAQAHEAIWLRQQLGTGAAREPSAMLAQQGLQRWGGTALKQPTLRLGVLALLALLPVGGLIAAWFGEAVVAFALLALAVPFGAIASGLEQLLNRSPWGARRGRWLRPGLDLALVMVAALSLGGPWYRAGLAPAVIGLSLALLDRRSLPPRAELLRDRGLLAALAAIALAVFPAEPVLSALAMLVLAANLLPAARDSG